MGEEAGSGPLGRLFCGFAILTCALALSGCLPKDDGGGKTAKQAAFSVSDSGENPGVNRSEKGDPLGASHARGQAGLLERTAARSEETVHRPALVNEANISAASLLVPANETQGSPEIADVPATVALKNFFRALGTLENGRGDGAVTVLHLGDSHIAADRFSGDMREQFQSRFGNAGRAMLMPGLYLARGVKFDQGGKWEAALSTGVAPGPYGVTGVKMSAKGREDWLRLTATDRPFTWSEITLETGPNFGNAAVSLDGEVKLVPCTAPSPSWTTIRLEKQAREVIIRPKGDGPISVHAISIGENKPGIRYINLGVPGATAATLLSWNAGEVASDLKRIAPDLIVVGYGTEESFDDGLSAKAYETRVTRMLGLLQEAAPQASLLVIGPPDLARLPHFAQGTGRASDVCRALSPAERAGYAQRVRSGDARLARWHPPIELDEVRQVLRRAAAASKAYFWDWSRIMGGTCGVHAWVHSDPPLAANDHIHLTEEGSKRSARLLFRELMTSYDAFDRASAASDAGAWKPGITQAAAPRKGTK
jgi:lysophospholipase L1-like esterase